MRFRYFLYFVLGYSPKHKNRFLNIFIAFRNLLVDPLVWFDVRQSFLARLSNSKSINDIVDLVFEFRKDSSFYNIRPIQSKAEITRLALAVSAIEPKVIVEIGTAKGGTLLIWSQCSQRLRHLVSIDLPAGATGGGYMMQKIKLFELYTANHPQCQLQLLRRDSQSPAAVTKVKDILHNEPIDFLFIDADHRYDGVKRDFELYSPLVMPGGLIAFHDILPNPSNKGIEVYKLWGELKEDPRYVAEEIIADPRNGVFGIGLLTKR